MRDSSQPRRIGFPRANLMKNKKYGIKAYDSWKRFSTRREYEGYLLEWIAGTDGAEQRRASCALAALYGGQKEYDSDAS